jgi:hypothetical protein
METKPEAEAEEMKRFKLDDAPEMVRPMEIGISA